MLSNAIRDLRRQMDLASDGETLTISRDHVRRIVGDLCALEEIAATLEARLADIEAELCRVPPARASAADAVSVTDKVVLFPVVPAPLPIDGEVS